MKSLRLVLSTLVIAALTGCFHQIVETGATPGSVVIDRTAKTWIFGLVAADEIDVRTLCPAGVAIVETKQSFMNGLLGAITIGIYTPQSVRVTCAAGAAIGSPHEIVVPGGAAPAQLAAAVHQAIRRSMALGDAVVVRF